MSTKPLNDRKLSKRTLVSAVLILGIIPLTILCSVLLIDDRAYVVDRMYYLFALLILFYTMIPFFMVFEKRKPQARELILIAVMAAIAVAGRAAFFMLPQFKPVVAIVIITAVCFGAEAGFMTGAVSGFVSNFFFGQGPWTPWQMFAFGIIGFLAGILFKKGMLPKKRLPLCVFGGASALVIYGALLNLSSFLSTGTEWTWMGLLSFYISGFWFDLIHMIATVFFLFVLANPMIEKLDRIKKKYGMMEP